MSDSNLKEKKEKLHPVLCGLYYSCNVYTVILQKEHLIRGTRRELGRGRGGQRQSMLSVCFCLLYLQSSLDPWNREGVRGGETHGLWEVFQELSEKKGAPFHLAGEASEGISSFCMSIFLFHPNNLVLSFMGALTMSSSKYKKLLKSQQIKKSYPLSMCLKQGTNSQRWNISTRDNSRWLPKHARRDLHQPTLLKESLSASPQIVCQQFKYIFFGLAISLKHLWSLLKMLYQSEF